MPDTVKEIQATHKLVDLYKDLYGALGLTVPAPGQPFNEHNIFMRIEELRAFEYRDIAEKEKKARAEAFARAKYLGGCAACARMDPDMQNPYNKQTQPMEHLYFTDGWKESVKACAAGCKDDDGGHKNCKA